MSLGVFKDGRGGDDDKRQVPLIGDGKNYVDIGRRLPFPLLQDLNYYILAPILRLSLHLPAQGSRLASSQRRERQRIKEEITRGEGQAFRASRARKVGRGSSVGAVRKGEQQKALGGGKGSRKPLRTSGARRSHRPLPSIAGGQERCGRAMGKREG